MNPQDALTQDYQMYYDGCWMVHKKYGVGRINVVDGDMYLTRRGSDMRKVKPSSLSCWWPRPGAFNKGKDAVYVARRAVRNMRKSAVGGDHYFIKWGSPYGIDVMLLMDRGPNQIPLRRALRQLKIGDRNSVAITRDIIIFPQDKKSVDVQVVVFRGVETGLLVASVYEPLVSCNPLTPRILRQLEAVL